MRMIPLRRDDHRLFRLWSRATLALVLAGSFGGCLKIAPTDGVLVCGAAPNICPSGYVCAADQHCWKTPPIGGSDMGSSYDLSIALNGGDDMSALPGDDLSVSLSTDMAHGLDPVDMAQPKPVADLATPPPPPDLAPAFNYCPSGTIFCDNFENDTIAINTAGNWSDTFVQPANDGQTLATGTTQKHDGTHALHAAANDGNANSWATIEYKLVTPQTSLAMRWFVFPVANLTNRGEVARIFSVADTNNNGFQVGGAADGKWFISDSLGGSPDHESSVSVTTGAWTCLELVVPATGNVQLYINGSTTPAISFAPLNHEPYDTIHAGVEWAPQGVPVDIWTDEVALNTSRLPCP